jgi:drug/metabolite transporter (DMT)-like permease
LRFIVTAVLALITVTIFWDFSSIWALQTIHWQLLWLIVFTSGAVALFLYYYGLRKVTASSATIFELTWPLSAIFFDWYFNDNLLTMTQVIFSLVLLVSFFMIIKEQKLK